MPMMHFWSCFKALLTMAKVRDSSRQRKWREARLGLWARLKDSLCVGGLGMEVMPKIRVKN